MDEKLPQENSSEQENVQTPPYRGLYRYGHISVKALDWIIVGCVVVIFIAVFLGRQQPGLLIQFDSQGGTPVESVRVEYGNLLTEPAAPTREGFDFTGWFRDPAAVATWNFQEDQVTDELTLYAGWQPKAP